MEPPALQLDATVPIPVLEPLRRVNAALLDLLASFTVDDWRRPTVHVDRSVKDLTAHLLQGSLNRVSLFRDGFSAPFAPCDGLEDLITLIQRTNREFMTAMRWVSPRVLIEQLTVYDRELLAVVEGLDPDAPGIPVAWAGESTSRNWFDVAREYTEKWHHQQQLRDATGRPPLYEPALLAPVLETFARGLPFAFRARDAEDGTAVAVTVTGSVTLDWTLRRANGAWSLWRGGDPAVRTSITMPADIAWRVWTKGLTPRQARAHMDVRGDETMAGALTAFVAIMA